MKTISPRRLSHATHDAVLYANNTNQIQNHMCTDKVSKFEYLFILT